MTETNLKAAVALAREPQALAEIERVTRALDGDPDTGWITDFGAGAQNRLQDITQAFRTAAVRRTAAPAAGALDDMKASLRGFSPERADLRASRSFWEWITGRRAPFANLEMRLAAMRASVDRNAASLSRLQFDLLRDMESLGMIDEKLEAVELNLAVFLDLGRAYLARIDREDLPALQAAMAEAGESGRLRLEEDAARTMMARADLERRLADLATSRTIAQATRGSVAGLREVAQTLVDRLDKVLNDIVPLWLRQLDAALALNRAETGGSPEGRIEDLRLAHKTLVEAISDSLNLADSMQADPA